MIPADNPWRYWLEELASEGKYADDAAVPFAMRGFEWRMEIIVDGDFSDYQLLGRVKANPDAADNLAVMDVFGPTLFEGQTYWRLTLPSTGTNGTDSFPTTQVGSGVKKYPMLLIFVPPDGEGPPYPLVGGLFTLLGAI